MKKFLVALLAIATTTAGFSAAADNKEKKCERKADDRRCTDTLTCKGDKDNCTAPNPFEGLNLTTEQQTKLNELRSQCTQQRAKAKADKKAQKFENKAAKRQARKERRTQMLSDIKAILTPEQYVQFLENNFVNGNQMKGGKAAKADNCTNFGRDAKMARQGKMAKDFRTDRAAKVDRAERR